VVDALVSGLAGLESRVLQQVTQTAAAQPPAGTAQPVEAIEILAAAVVKGGNAAEVQVAVDAATNAQRPAWVRTALLEGLIAALPPAPVAGRGNPVRLPGLSEPGSRFAQVAAGRGVSLPAEPAGLARLVTGGGTEGQLAAELTARLNWAGKPAPPAAPPVAPLTADETARFDKGAATYGRMCAGCHGANGEGRDKVGAPLAGSRYVTAAQAAVPMRILMNGKEGPIGLMPPVTSSLNDDQVAELLTYLRRAWGNTASPVTTIEVRETRQSNLRTTVWTEEELAATIGGRGGRGGGGGGRGNQQPAGRGGQ
jgi:mono/diheme cytochrome c family protein